MMPVLGSISSLIPETAPFSNEQRAWLNGFFSGFIALEHAVAQGIAAIPAPLPDGSAAASDGDDAPWHDPSLPMSERMTLAEGRPLRRRMMAAMAQQDCGQCGYNCRDYADAIADEKEARLNLCVPGGKETARMLKSLHGELKRVPASPAVASGSATVGEPAKAESVQAPTGRDNPATATFIGRRRLNKHGSEKDAWHVEFDLAESGLDYTVGDSFGIFPENDPSLVREILVTLWVDPEQKRGDRTLTQILMQAYSLNPAPDTLFQLFSYLTGGALRQKAKALAAGEDPDGDAATLDVLAGLRKFPGVRPGVEAFLETLEPLQPRLYSISSSPKAFPRRLSLTVDSVRYRINRRTRLGCASTFLAERVQPGTRVKAYIQKAHNFGLLPDPDTPIIMVGPGTGVAPFRAFLQERQICGAKGRNWLFFGHQRSVCDFFYEDELNAMKAAGVLTRLSLAWSRDGTEKFYVQDRMRETGRDLWAWLAEGAHFYICGDAKRMAKDVERALVDIACQHGGLTPDKAATFIADLKKTKRFQADVY